MSLTNSAPSDIRSQATSLPVEVTPHSVGSLAVTNVPQVSINMYEIRPFVIPDETEKGCRCTPGWIFLVMLLIVLSGISIALLIMYT
jgi:hypothetical protein